MGERERTQEYGNEIHCHVYTLAKFQENTTVLYIHVQYTIDTMNMLNTLAGLGIRNVTCAYARSELAVGARIRVALARSRSALPRGSRTALGRAKGLEENGAGPSGGGGGIFKHTGQGQARWAFKAWGSGGNGIYRAQLPSLFYCTSHMVTVFITSNQIPLHVHAVFCHNIIITCTLYTSGARHDAHAYS